MHIILEYLYSDIIDITSYVTDFYRDIKVKDYFNKKKE